jgi:phage shock protein E
MKLRLAIFIFMIFPLIGEGMIIIDVRTLDEWQNGHLEEAQHIEWQDILSISNTTSKDQEIYLYCRSGNRSGKATQLLLDAGYTGAVNAGSMEMAAALFKSEIVK